MLDRPVMSTLHAFYSTGYLLSALVGGLLASAGLGLETHLALVGAIAAVTVLATSRWLVADRPGEGEVTGLAWPSRHLLLLGTIAFCALLTEGSITDWGSVYVKNVLDGSPALAGAAFGTFGAGMALSRLTGDRLRSRFGPIALVDVGAATGLALAVALALSSPAAIVPAFLVAGLGLGLGNVFPVALAAAGFSRGDASVGAAVASVATVGYTGFLRGPALIGPLTAGTSLTGALCLLVVAMMAVIALARTTRPATVARP